jgi:hypothetical protein
MFDAELFKSEMKLLTNNVRKYYDAEDAWDAYERANIAIQGAWYQGLVDKKTMQETIADFAMAAVEAQVAEEQGQEGDWLYGYFYRPL